MKSSKAEHRPYLKSWQPGCLLVFFLISITLLFAPAPAHADTPSLALQFYGKVYDNGTLVGPGYTVMATIGGDVKASAVTDSQGRYGYDPVFLVGCTAGEVITFFVNTQRASENITASVQPARLLDLHVSGATPNTDYIVTTILGKSENLILNNGQLITGRELSSADGRVSLTLANYTTLNLGGATTLSAASQSNAPAASDNSTLLRAYSLTPSGATFIPAATLKLKYEPSWLPSGASESSLYIAYWTGSTWSSLASTCNTTANFVSAPVSHFTIFALRAPKTTAAVTSQVKTTILGKSENITLSNGKLAAARELTSADGTVSLKLAGNTAVDLKGASTLSAVLATNPPAASDNSTSLRAYSFTPAGATFSPAATLQLKYEPAWLPSGVSESSLYIAYWTGSTWSSLASTCNTTANFVSAPVPHSATFSIRAPAPKKTETAKPSFVASDLVVTPEKIGKGEKVTVTVKVTNNGTASDNQTITLKLNNKNEAQQAVSLGAGKSKVVTFSLSKNEPGAYRVSVNNLTGTFEVITGAASGALSVAAWPVVIILIICGVLLIVFVLFMVFKKR